MSIEQSSRPSSAAIAIGHLTNLAIFGVIVFMLWLMSPFIIERLSGASMPIQPTPEPATVATPRPYVPPAILPRPAQEAAPAAAPVVQPTAYTQATAEAIADHAYQEAIQQAELNAPALPNASKEVVAPVEAQPGVNADWCRGSHLSRPECQPGNGQKVER